MAVFTFELSLYLKSLFHSLFLRLSVKAFPYAECGWAETLILFGRNKMKVDWLCSGAKDLSHTLQETGWVFLMKCFSIHFHSIL